MRCINLLTYFLTVIAMAYAVPPNILFGERRSPTYYHDMGER